MMKRMQAALAAILVGLLMLGLLAPLASASEAGIYRAQLDDYGIHAEAAWDAGLTGAGVTVAVIDSGLNAGHMYGPKNIVAGRHFYWREEEDGKYYLPDGKQYNYFSNDDTTDPVGHGTVMAGIIADIAPGATIMPIRCFDAPAGDPWGYDSLLTSAIDYAVEHGADVINLSVGYHRVSPMLHDAVKRAVNAGCVVIAAVGHKGDATFSYPAAYEEVIGVGSTNRAGDLAAFSNCNGSTSVCALGENVRSIGWTRSDVLAKCTGTSPSAAIVSGGVALAKEVYPEMTQGELMALLERNCDPVAVGEGVAPEDAGAGALNVDRLVRSATARRLSLMCTQLVRLHIEICMKEGWNTT